MRRLVVCLALAGCGDNIGMFASGTRLEAIIETGGAGSEVLAYFHDRELDLDCTFAPDRSGAWRCMPRQRAIAVGFVDAACTQPIYRCPGCGADELEVTIAEVGCAAPTGLPTRLHASDPPAFVLAGTNVCVPIVAPTDRYYDAELLADEPYVSATFDDRVAHGALGARSLVTADGAREMHHAYITGDDRSCTFLGGPGQQHPCLPGTPARTELGLVYFFDSATCATRIATSPRRADCEPTTHVGVEGVAHTVVGELAAPVFERSPMDSRCFESQQDLRFWEIGPSDDSLPTADVMTLGEGAARPVYYAAGGSPLEFTGRWVDAHNAPCTPEETAAGRRCVPRAVALPITGQLWADPECSEELVYNPESLMNGIRSAPAAAIIASVHPLTRYYGTNAYEVGSGGCALQAEPAVLLSYVGVPTDFLEIPAVVVRPLDD
jgi:hypothetical protein